MDKITDLFQGLKERLNNPLIASFIIAWLIINWQIPIGIIFYGNETLAIDGYKSKIDLVKKIYSPWYCIWLPLVSALVYTFGFPVIKNWIRFFYAWTNKWGTDGSLKISKDGSISVSKYLGLRSEYIERTKHLQEVIQSESHYLKENSAINLRLNELQSEKNQLLSEKSEILEKNKITFLNGYWKIKHKRTTTGDETHERVLIKDAVISSLKKGTTAEMLFRINNYSFNPTSNEFILIIEDARNKSIYFVIMKPLPSNKPDRLQSHINSIITEMERD